MKLNHSRSINGSNFATPDNSESVFPASPAGNYQVGQAGRLKSKTFKLVRYTTNIYFQEGESGELCGAPLANWVTVWGFPPSAASFILQQVSSPLQQGLNHLDLAVRCLWDCLATCHASQFQLDAHQVPDKVSSFKANFNLAQSYFFQASSY